ncbi:MAG: anti-sigma regulatory factor [Anaerolineae bacterium]|nr:anti-sigma regulatory factor [Anaerolineae bacterium]RIK22741.1 MAG: anti-sigma regulatory factor [Anaerolineae bacterium]
MNLEPLTLPGEIAYLSQLMDYVTWAAAAAGLDEQATYRLSLAVDEIATNIVIHSYQETGRTGDLTIRAETDADKLLIYLEDTGIPFDPREEPFPDHLDLPLEERRDGGLGIYLALWGVDAFHYEQVDGKNRCVFMMNRPSTAGDAPFPES